jgi:diguanylate cyclase (GGDEF)-like protein
VRERRTTLTWRLIAGLFVVVAALLAIDIVRAGGRDPVAWSMAVAIAVLAALAVVYHREVLALAGHQRAEAESLNRILRGLSRSASPDAVLGGIASELRAATGADHCVVVRRRPRSRLLDATLVSGSAVAPAAATTLPSVLLEMSPDEADGPAAAAVRISAAVGSFFGLEHLRAEPLVTSRGVVGALVLSRRRGGRWSATALRLLRDAAKEASVALERAYAHAETEAAATTDQLTGLPNRRFLEILAARPAGRRRDDELAVLMVDIDHFKHFNDRFGHAAGDGVLRAVADAIVRTVRTDDFPIRYGGEEFLVVLRRADREIAVAVAERLRRNVAGIDIAALRLPSAVTVSVGVAVGAPALDTLIGRADAALYRAKSAGRDRVVLG